MLGPACCCCTFEEFSLFFRGIIISGIGEAKSHGRKSSYVGWVSARKVSRDDVTAIPEYKLMSSINKAGRMYRSMDHSCPVQGKFFDAMYVCAIIEQKEKQMFRVDLNEAGFFGGFSVFLRNFDIFVSFNTKIPKFRENTERS